MKLSPNQQREAGTAHESRETQVPVHLLYLCATSECHTTCCTWFDSAILVDISLL